MALRNHLHKLEYFCAVVDAKSILHASNIVGITQPQVSRVIKQLEDDLGKKLFTRGPKGVQPTKDGWALHKAAKKILSEIDRVEMGLLSKARKLTGKIRVGTYDSIARYFFGSFLRYFQTFQPNFQISLETGRSLTVREKIQSGLLDVGLFVRQAKEKKVEKMEYHTLFEDSFGLYQHPKMNSHFAHQWIVFEDSLYNTRDKIEKLRVNFGFRNTLYSDNLETVRALAEDRVGVGVLPHLVARSGVLQGNLVQVREIALDQKLSPHEVVLGWKTDTLSEQHQIFVEELCRYLESWVLRGSDLAG